MHSGYGNGSSEENRFKELVYS